MLYAIPYLIRSLAAKLQLPPKKHLTASHQGPSVTDTLLWQPITATTSTIDTTFIHRTSMMHACMHGRPHSCWLTAALGLATGQHRSAQHQHHHHHNCHNTTHPTGRYKACCNPASLTATSYMQHPGPLCPSCPASLPICPTSTAGNVTPPRLSATRVPPAACTRS